MQITLDYLEKMNPGEYISKTNNSGIYIKLNNKQFQYVNEYNIGKTFENAKHLYAHRQNVMTLTPYINYETDLHLLEKYFKKFNLTLPATFKKLSLSIICKQR